MKLSTFLADAATLYRRYGDIEIYVETPHHIYKVSRLDPDIWNVEDNVSAIVETEQVDSESPDIPSRQKQPLIPEQRRDTDFQKA